MDPDKFAVTAYGRPARGPHGYCVYLPNTIPRIFELSSTTVSWLSRADRALGRLAGSGRLLPNPQLLINSYTRREAVASTRIEGTNATLEDLFDAEAGGRSNEDIREVMNYLNALSAGIDRVNIDFLSIELIRDLHRILLDGVRGQNKRPGEIRASPNWIGGDDPATAIFVPPPVGRLDAGLEDWIAFAFEDDEIPPLVRCAILHYQFETLHPFLDGNGRLGRLLIVLYLLGKDYLPHPLLYLSSYFETHRSEYYSSLQQVRENGDVQPWLQYFLHAVSAQAQDAIARAERLVDLREKYRAALSGSRSHAPQMIDLLFINPFISTSHASSELGVSLQAAINLLRGLEKQGILSPTSGIAGRSRRWVAPEILKILTEPQT